MPQTQEKPKLERMGAVWVKTGQRGKYLSLSIGPKGKSVNYVGYPNKYKNGDNDPGYIIYASQPYKRPSPPQKHEEDLEDNNGEQESDDLL